LILSRLREGATADDRIWQRPTGFGVLRPHKEHIREDASDADENALLISRDYKPGCVLWQMAHPTIAELAASRMRHCQENASR
jgi:hypothetical protein